MTTLGLDADAFIFLRKLGLLDDLVALASPPEPRISLHTTGYVAHHELSDLSTVLALMVAGSTLTISQVKTKTRAFALLRELQEAGYDKGESELGAWIATESELTVLVSCDLAVPKMAKGLKIKALDLGRLVVVLVKDGLMAEATAAERLKPWENPHTGIGRPRWWTTLADALAAGHPLAPT